MWQYTIVNRLNQQWWEPFQHFNLSGDTKIKTESTNHNPLKRETPSLTSRLTCMALRKKKVRSQKFELGTPRPTNQAPHHKAKVAHCLKWVQTAVDIVWTSAASCKMLPRQRVPASPNHADTTGLQKEGRPLWSLTSCPETNSLQGVNDDMPGILYRRCTWQWTKGAASNTE